MSLEKIGSLKDFKEGEGKLIKIKDREIAVFRIKDKFYAVDEYCTHVGGPLHEGEIENGKVICPWHGAMFDLKTGRVLRPPASEDIKSYEVTIKGEDVFIKI
jgi:nitrite reductase/ring-hydroxylating ferredoxin subunit